MVNESASKIWIGAIALLIVVGGAGYWFYEKNQQSPITEPEVTPIVADERKVPTTPTTPGVGVTVLDKTSVDTSDAALDADMAAIDTNISALSSDGVAADKSMTDQPIPLAE